MRNKKTRRAAALALLLSLLLALAPPALAADTVEISSADDLLALARACALDSWSRGKTFVLTCDVSLASVDFAPIPTFGGTFDGGGHTISGLALSAKLSPAGLFGVVQEGAEVRNLTLSGSVTPAGDGWRTGGIAGENRGRIANCSFIGTVAGQDSVGGVAGRNMASGRIENCRVSGSVTGESMTGGIAGENHGLLSLCRSSGYVNITSLDPGLDLSQFELRADALTPRTLETANISTDTGGVAGFSDGTLLRCSNDGTVGYPHVGYNVGGIAGRSSGFLSGCTNSGPVFGRKDVGGVAGQAEPHIALDLSEDQLDAIERQLDALEARIDEAAGSIDGASGTISDAFDAVNDSLDAASDSARTLSDRLSGYGGDVVSEVNRGGDVLSEAADRLSDALARGEGLPGQLTAGLDALGGAVDGVAAAGDAADPAVAGLGDAAGAIAGAGAELSDGLNDLRGGLEKLTGAFGQSDSNALAQAAQQLAAGAGAMSDAAARTAEAVEALADALDGESGEAARRFAASLQELSASLGAFRDSLAGRSFPEVDLDAIRSALDGEVDSALSRLSGAADGVTEAARALSDALDAAEPASDQLDAALDTLSGALDSFSDASETGADALDELHALADYLADVEPIQIQRPDEVLEEASDALFEALDRLGAGLDRLNDAASSSADSLTGSLRAVNGQFGALMDTVVDAARDLGDPDDPLSDISEADVEGTAEGRIYACSNSGRVTGDLCVGGVAGSMAVEYELDPEDDILGDDSPVYRRAYTLKAILHECVNDGEVCARRDYAGGLCGRMQLGLAAACENYGPVSSENGDYVGGVAGFAAGTVRGCFAKCTLSGADCVGGIAGAAGVPGDPDGGTVSGCVSFVEIPACEQHAGAVAGMELGSFEGNFFTSDTLAGLGRASLSGEAEPLSYEALMALDGIPARFRELTLRFIDGETVVKSVAFRYGDSFGADVFPILPGRDGEFARWDTQTLQDLRFDTDVRAVYEPYLISLASGTRRGDGRPVLFCEGRFRGGDALALERAEEPVPAGDTWLDRRTPVEQWRLEIPDDGAGFHTLRYLSPSGRTEGLEVYTLWNGVWSRVETEAVGSYLTFTAEGGAPVLAVVARSSLLWMWALAAAALALLLVLAWRLIRWLRTRKKSPKAKKPPKTKKPAGRRRRTIVIVLVFLAVLVGLAALLLSSGLLDHAAAARLLYRCAADPSIPLELTVEAGFGDERYRAQSDILRTELDGETVTCVSQFGAAVYYCGGRVYLENGASYPLGGGSYPDYAALLDSVKLLYENGESSVYRNGAETIYSLTLGEGADELLRGLLPGVELPAVLSLDVDLAARSGALSSVRFTADCRDGGYAAATLSVPAQAGSPVIPESVREAIEGGAADGGGQTALLEAWGERNLRDPLAAEVSVQADCGPLVRDGSLSLYRTLAGGKWVRCVQKTGRAWYYAGGTVYDGDGEETEGEESAALAELPELAYRLCLKRAAARGEKDGAALYTIPLTPEERESVARAIAPEAETLDASYTSGALELVVADGGLETIRFICAGTVRVQSVAAAARLSCELRLRDSAFSLPEAVETAVEREK